MRTDNCQHLRDLWRWAFRDVATGERYAQIMCNPYTGLRTLEFNALAFGRGWALCLVADNPNCRWVGNANPAGIGGPP